MNQRDVDSLMERNAHPNAALPPVRSEPLLAVPRYRSVVELCADNPNLAEYIRQMENELAQLKRCAGCHWVHHAPYTYPCTECAGGDMFCTANAAREPRGGAA